MGDRQGALSTGRCRRKWRQELRGIWLGSSEECLLGREKSFDQLLGILLYVLSVGDIKIKMSWTLRRAFISGNCLSLWHYWVHEMLPSPLSHIHRAVPYFFRALSLEGSLTFWFYCIYLFLLLFLSQSWPVYFNCYRQHSLGLVNGWISCLWSHCLGYRPVANSLPEPEMQ